MSYLQKIILLLLLLFYHVNSAFSDEFIRLSKYIQKANQHFNGTYWVFRIKEYKDIRIVFLLPDDNIKENKFKIIQVINDHEEEIGYGTYIIKNGIIDSFKVIECKNKVASILKDQKIRLYYTDQDLEYDYYLLLEKSNLKLWGYSFLRFKGLERKANGIPVIIVEYPGYTIENAQIRTYPSLDNNTVKYIDKNKNELNSVPKDISLFVYARTKNKYQVGQSYNYWYLVDGIKFSESAVDTVFFKYIWIYADSVRYSYTLDQDWNKIYPTGFPYD